LSSKRYGPTMKQYFIEKLLEAEKYNASGRYPVDKLWSSAGEVDVSDGVRKVISGMRSLYRTLQKNLLKAK
jgi:hypothetical protein